MSASVKAVSRLSLPAAISRMRPGFGQLLLAAAIGAALGFVIPIVPAWLAVALAPALILMRWLAHRPAIGLLLLMAVTGGLVNYDQLPYLSLGPVSFHVTDLLLLYLLGLALVRLLAQRDFRYVATPLDRPLLLFFGMVLLSVLTAVLQFGVTPNVAIRELRIATYWLAFFAVTQLIRTQRQLDTLVNGLMILSILMTAAVTLQMAIPSLPLVRVSSETLVTAGREFAGVSRVWITGERLIYTMLIVAVCAWLMVKSSRARREYGGLSMILFVWLFLSFQRNYWTTTAMALGILTLIIDWPQRARAFKWLALTVLIVVIVFTAPGSPLATCGEAAADRIFSAQESRLAYDTSALLRQFELEQAIRKVAEYPIFGVGIGNDYRPWVQRFDYFPGAVVSNGLIWYCHNAYMWIWVKMGTPSLLVFLWLCAVFVRRGLRLWRRIPDSKGRAIVVGFTLAFVGQMVSNLVAPNFIQNWVLVVYPITMGVNELLYKWNGLESTKG